jgi:hypothetical protein
MIGSSILLTSLFLGCGCNWVGGQGTPEQLTLYSIDGRRLQPGQEVQANEKFHGYPVLGKIEIADADKRKEVFAALKEGLARSNGTMAKCFWPRHGIPAVEKGRTIDYVICFECLQLEAHEGDSKRVMPVTWGILTCQTLFPPFVNCTSPAVS